MNLYTLYLKVAYTSIQRYFKSCDKIILVFGVHSRNFGGFQVLIFRRFWICYLVQSFVLRQNSTTACAGQTTWVLTRFWASLGNQTQKGRIGISLDITWFEPLSSRSFADMVASERMQAFQVGWWAVQLRVLCPQSERPPCKIVDYGRSMSRGILLIIVGHMPQVLNYQNCRGKRVKTVLAPVSSISLLSFKFTGHNQLRLQYSSWISITWQSHGL